jgi:hypothetical protein
MATKLWQTIEINSERQEGHDDHTTRTWHDAKEVKSSKQVWEEGGVTKAIIEAAARKRKQAGHDTETWQPTY